jgi:hypothetical protein
MTNNQQDNPQDSTQDNTQTIPTVPVVLRAWRNGGEVFALFPTLPSDEHGVNFGRHCNAYAHVGQHSGADYRLCIRTSRPATATEGAPLIQELERIGYRPRIVQRATASMHEERKAEARRVWAG